MKYIFVTGGVMSGIGKGVATAAIGRILKSKGFKVTAIKIDPYINVDAGTMNPVEHGEVFVTEDGTECDQDIGNYERFLDENIFNDNYMTTGRVYQAVITKERNLEYHGKCVEVVPDIPNEVIATIKKAGLRAKADFVLIEIGGTVGEYQNLLFLEAGRMMKISHPRDVLFILVSYMPVPDIIGEMKTKPTQYAVRTLNSAGIQPDMILARSTLPLDEPRKRKLSNFCNIAPEDIISAPDVASIYQVPLNFEKEHMGNRILKKFGMKPKPSNLADWEVLVNNIATSSKVVKVGIVGKYFESGKFTLTDSYISVLEAVKHASFSLHKKPQITWLSAEDFESDIKSLQTLKQFDGIIVPGGFGSRGVEGKIKAVQFCRENNIPYFGLCYGLHMAVIEFARNVCGLKDANTTEVNPKTKFPVIDIMPEQKKNLKLKNMGASMRLGAYDCQLKKGTQAYTAYKQDMISERHRHRYEVNSEYIDALSAKGLIASGINPGTNLVEIIEIKNHPFFVATQFHPELKSRPLAPHPLFLAFIKAAIKKETA
jgi:CTP synthase